jgi:chloramphenicol 3-O-phosphotransferase
MVMFGYDSYILVEAEDRAGEQERLRHVVEQPACHIVDMDHLVAYECDTAHDEQHRTGVLRDFEAFVVFHGIVVFNFLILHQGCFACCAEDGGDDVTDHLEDRSYCLVHTFDVLNGLKIRVVCVAGTTSLTHCKDTKKS